MSYRRKHISPKIKSLKKKKPLFLQPVFWAGVLGLVILGTVFWAVFFWQEAQVQAVVVQGNDSIPGPEIESITWQLINGNFLGLPLKNILLINPSKIHEILLKRFPKISEAKVEKKFMHSLVVTIKERKPEALFCNPENECFLIDKAGVIFESATKETKTLPVITTDSKNQEFQLGESAISQDTMDASLNIAKNLQEKFGIITAQVLAGNPLIVTTSEGWKAYFGREEGIESQIRKMNALLEEKISQESRKKMQYIYLQYKDRAYYK